MTSKSTTTQKKQLSLFKAPLKQDWNPHKYQKKVVKLFLENACFGAILDPGLGKTSISLAVTKILKREKLVRKVLIVVPKRPMYLVWPAEIEKWNDFKNITYTILHGKDKDKNLKTDVDIYLINPEGLLWLLKQNFKQLGFDMLIVDESSKFKSTKSLRFKLLKQALKYFRRRYILTGSFSPNGLLDIFGQVYIVDMGNALGSYITHYRNSYFYPSGYGGYTWKIQPGAEERIKQKIKPLVIHMEDKDYLDLPEIICNPIYIDLPLDVRELYDEMEKELIIKFDRNEIVAANAAVASMKCCQIANGGVYNEDGTALLLHMEKAEAVEELVSELNGSPVLIAYEFGHDLERLRKVLGKDVPYIGGGVSVKRSTEIERTWNRGELTELLGQPASVAHGLNLQGAGNHVCWHSLTWNFEYYDQFIKRVRRQGNKHKKVFVHQIIARNTVDEAKIAAIALKDKTQRSLLSGLKGYLDRKRKSS